VAARSKAWVCVLSLAVIAGMNLAGCMDVSLVSVVCCQVVSLRGADHLSRGALPSVVCLSVIVNLGEEALTH
jgi:hypothetical protein